MKQTFLVAAALTVGASTSALGQEDATTNDNETEMQIEEVVVYGFGQSASNAMALKKDSVGVVDGIYADSIGLFPDLNVSESLQRLPGLTVNRSVTGEGNTISVRGLPPEFNRVTLNGMTATSGNEGREFDFDIFASELFSSITVTKTPSASLTEGGLAGTIDLRTPRPLGFASNTFLVSAGGQYAEIGTDEVTPRLSGLYSWKNSDETFGVAMSAAVSESIIRNDTRQGFRYELLRNNSGLDDLLEAGDPVSVVVDGQSISDREALTDIANTVAFPVLPRVGVDIKERDRLGLTGSLEFKPNERTYFAVDLLYAEFEENGERHTIDGAPGFSGSSSVPVAIETIDGGAVTYAPIGTFSGVSQRAESVDETFDSELTQVTLEGRYDLNQAWTLSTNVGYSEASEDELRRTYIYNNVGEFSYDITNPEWPVFSGASFDYLDPNDYTPNQLRFRPRSREDEAVEARFDAEFDPDSSYTFEFGVELRDRAKENIRLQELRPTPSLPFSELATSLPVDDFNEGAPAGVVTDFLVTDLDLGRQLLLPETLLQETSIDLRASWEVEETITSAYAQFNYNNNWLGFPVSMNAGVRVSHTDQTSSGSQQVGSDFSPISIDNDYSDVLPSLNIKVGLSDSVIARFAANRAITRPTLSQLSAGTTVGSINNLTARSGNPELDPFRADQFDLGIEWYFANDAVLGTVLFYKDMESFIVTSEETRVIEGDNLINDAGENVSGEEFLVTLPVNGTGGELSGIELFYQQPLPFLEGLGVIANATFSDSEGEVTQGGETTVQPLQGQSDLSYNFIAYYDNDLLSIRAAYSFRDDYIAQFRSRVWPSGRPHTLFVDDRGQLDISVRAHIHENFTVFADAINLLGENAYSFDTLQGMSRDYFAQDTIYNFGLRAQW